ncbi:hypothetical protein MSAN_00971800 [Mycena sanguinolenta]|uniref:Uncharacterized protein n=1 Tax=Mycena sanguinolenta TaxID=230812 RepID=A0A8H7DD19_9AGAR|nr:hypothetical protein MSAN_00971800 [Mycena sanguinolenta]
MAASTTKGRYTLMSLHPVPAHLSTKEFATKVEMASEAHLSLPVCREGLLKHEISLADDSQRSTRQLLQGTGLWDSAADDHSEGRVQEHRSCRTASQILNDPEVIKVVKGEEGFADASIFAVDEIIGIDTQSSDEYDCTWVTTLKRRPHFSADQFSHRCKEITDGLMQLPGFRENVGRHVMWIKHESFAQNVQELGAFLSEPLVIIMWQSSVDRMNAALSDSGVKQFFAGLKKPLTEEIISNRFAVDVVVKV